MCTSNNCQQLLDVGGLALGIIGCMHLPNVRDLLRHDDDYVTVPSLPAHATPTARPDGDDSDLDVSDYDLVDSDDDLSNGDDSGSDDSDTDDADPRSDPRKPCRHNCLYISTNSVATPSASAMTEFNP